MIKTVIIGMGLWWCIVVPWVHAQETHDLFPETQPLIDTQRLKYQRTPVNKLGRGAINTLTCWMEVPAQIYKVSKEKNEFRGSTLGFLQGICTSALRLGTGLADMASFFVPPYDRPFMEPEYAFDDLEKRTEEYELRKR